jgi:AcrR family transcriptional regulator
MTVVITKRRERKKAAARSAILSAAIELFSQHGIDSVTVDQIAAAADVGKGTIYNYFSTKEDIVVAFMAELESRVQVRLRRFIAGNGSLDAILARFIEFQFRMKAPYHSFVRVFLGQMVLRTEQFFPYIVEMQRVIDPPLEAFFAALQDRGLIKSEIDLAQLTLSFKTMHLGLTTLWAIEGPPFLGTRDVVRKQMIFFCEGIGVTR